MAKKKRRKKSANCYLIYKKMSDNLLEKQIDLFYENYNGAGGLTF